ncbi:folylpolyglutamate synthase, mitochondrial-like [Euwallacea fornicatus]|uniref:folylpolyglutamate synthase, mitochondrial-like n=1 Tax=Euwallacea fornicatus TaxID=995702 RepID=UPI00338FA97F
MNFFLRVVMLDIFSIWVRRCYNQFPQLATTVGDKAAATMSTNYKDAIDTLNKLQSNAEYIKRAKIKNNQEHNMQEMAKFLNRTGISLEQLDNLPVIHIAGTKGKGTTSSYCESILNSHGYKTGFYSSPHLLEVRERIRLNGVPISQVKFASNFWKVYTRLDKQKSAPYDMPLYFRFLTILALHIFIAEKVDAAILEVGIGGEYDCTNVVRKTLVAGITPLDIDHTALLGNTLESIAWNKGGIMKPRAEVFTSVQPNAAMKVLNERSHERQCNIHVVKDLYMDQTNSSIPLHVQQTNASLALSISECFMKIRPRNNQQPFSLKVAKDAIKSAKWPGRYQIIQRSNFVFFLDGAHTTGSMEVCSKWFSSNAQDNRIRVLIFNVTGDRSSNNLMKILLNNCQFDMAIFIPNVGDDSDNLDTVDQIQPVQRQLERCFKHKNTWDCADYAKCNESKVFSSFSKALKYLESQEGKRFNVLVTGSIHLIGAALSVLDPTLDGLL